MEFHDALLATRRLLPRAVLMIVPALVVSFTGWVDTDLLPKVKGNNQTLKDLQTVGASERPLQENGTESTPASCREPIQDGGEADIRPSSDSLPRLRLELLSATPVPEGFDVRNAAFLDPDRALLWGSTGVIWMQEGLVLKTLRFPPNVQNPVGLAASTPTLAETTLEILEPDSGRTLRIIDRERIDDQMSWGLELTVLQAVPAAGSWVTIAASGVDGERTVIIRPRSNESGQATLDELADLATHPGFVSSSGNLRIVGHGRGEAFLAEEKPPFRVWSLRPGTAVYPELELLLDGFTNFSEFHVGEFDPEFLVPLAVIDLDKGWLYQLADLRSDRRVVILIDTSRSIARAATVNVSLGFMAAQWEQRHLIGLRDLGALEIVFYQWRWEGRDRRDHFSDGDVK